MKTSLKVVLALSWLSAATNHAFADEVHTTGILPGYQCMSLANLWSGVGPMPPPVQVYNGPNQSASPAGIAGGSVIVPDPVRPVDGRTSMIFADGRKVWIDVNDIKPWHAVSNPHATCTPVLLSNGRYGFETRH